MHRRGNRCKVERLNHFILTRFNLRLWWKEDKCRHAIQTEEWLEERFRLFDIYTWPSVRSQTCQAFKWICLFDEQTPQRWKERVEQYRQEWDGFIPVYCNREKTRYFREGFAHLAYKYADKDDPLLLTTYLDNDDCLHREFVEDVQRRAEKIPMKSVISYEYGLQYYEGMNLAVRIPYRNNHFLSYIEPLAKECKTVWGFWHFSIFKYKNLHVELVSTSKRPMWIEVIHQGNIDNDVKMTLCHRPVLQRNCLRDYGLDRHLQPAWRTIATFLGPFMLRFMRQIVRRGWGKLKD